jgi:hypothetical protein
MTFEFHPLANIFPVLDGKDLERKRSATRRGSPERPTD